MTSAVSGAVTNVKSNLTQVTAAPPTAAPADIQPGGTLTYGRSGDIGSFDPIKLTGTALADGVVADLLYDVLLYSDARNGAIVPQTAESLTSTDAVNWTLKLRPNIKFSDGTPYDAAAVKFNFDRLKDPANAAQKAAQANLMDSITAVDATTLKIVLKSKNAVFPVALTLIPYVASPKAVTEQGAKYGTDANGVGAGPFLLKSWVRDSQMTFVRNPSYWNAPQPYLDQVNVKPIIDESQRANTFMGGQADMINLVTASIAAQVQKAGNSTIQPMVLNGGVVMFFNTKKPPFTDPAARQAIAQAIDNTDAANVIDSGLSQPIDSIFRHESPFYDSSLLQPFNDQTRAKATAASVAAGNGGKFQFTLAIPQSTNYENIAQYYQGALAKAGITMGIVENSAAKQVSICPTGQYEGACLYTDPFDDPEPTWTTFFTCNASPSPTGWCNAKFDADVQGNQQTLDPQARINFIKDAQRQFYAEMPALYPQRRLTWMYTRTNVQGFRYIDDGIPLIGELWLKR